MNLSLSSVDVKALTESALFVRELCYDPLDVENALFCQNINAFVSKLQTCNSPVLTSGELKNCCIFLSNFIENCDPVADTKNHRLLLFRLTEVLRRQEGL